MKHCKILKSDNKAVLASISPKWCEKIASGEKTIEVRKTRPKCETPFKCYIYCPKPKKRVSLGGGLFCFEDDLAILNRHGLPRIGNPWGSLDEGERIINGRVIGEFVCNAIDAARANNGVQTYYNIPNGTCLTDEQIIKYAAGKTLYLWHISDLKIYDMPKKLSEFHKPCTPECNFSEECGGATQKECLFALTRPPQSWCYVEGV